MEATGTYLDLLAGANALVLVVGLVAGSVQDLRSREASDLLWQLMAVFGSVSGAVVLAGSGELAVGLWLLLAAFVLQHLIPWDVELERFHEWLPTAVEVVLYGGVGLVLAYAGLSWGVGSSGLPVAVIAVYVSVLLARGLFELGVLYGGADAKALMVAGLLVPLFPTPLIHLPGSAGSILSIYPFSLSLLMDAALFSIAVPIALAVRNLRRGDFEFPRGFTGFVIDVRELPDRFVWLKDPTFDRLRPDDEPEPETSEEDRRLRERQRDALLSQGVARVWVTPQLPFLVLLAAGAVGALVAGNAIFDLFALL